MDCRCDPRSTTPVITGSFGGPGSGYTVQCSGWFPDWISPNPPPADVEAFQLSQGYILGTPIVEGNRFVRWDPPEPATGAQAPWLAFDFHVASQRVNYLNALKEYALAGMPEVDFVGDKNATRRWYHVPMMTSSPSARREPYHGVTKERGLRANEHSWIIDGASNDLDSYAVGYYNALGGYTVGQVFGDPDPALADPAKSRFIDGAFVFKLIFAEYDATKIDAALNPLDGAPEWQVQNVEAPADPLTPVRLLQVDIAVKDPRSAQTGWVFATFVYDKSVVGAPTPWHKLAPVGLQWGNDPDVTGPGVGTIDETWLASGVPAAYGTQVGWNGRLNGPVDNPDSSCISCHSTAQVVVGAGSRNAFRGARLAPSGCSNTQRMFWFRNLLGTVAFGVMGSGGTACTPASPPTATPPLHGLDYSLQLADGLESALFFANPNPCAELLARDVEADREKRAAQVEKPQMHRMRVERIERKELGEEFVKRLEEQKLPPEARR